MINVKIDDSELKRSLVKFTNTLNKDAEESIKELAGVAATQLANRSEPFGLTSKAETIAKKSVYKDINNTFDNTGAMYNKLKMVSPGAAVAFIKAINDNDLQQAENYASRFASMVSTTAQNETLRQNRTSPKKHVPKGIKQAVVGDKESISNIEMKSITNIGLTKAGFLQAGKDVGSKKAIPKWLKNDEMLGYADVFSSGWKTIVTLHNNVRYASNTITDSKIDKALNTAYRNHLKKLDKTIEHAWKKSD